jgi:hypothetical protein
LTLNVRENFLDGNLGD